MRGPQDDDSHAMGMLIEVDMAARLPPSAGKQKAGPAKASNTTKGSEVREIRRARRLALRYKGSF